ncbi:MAG TPA: serine/threonine protein kinase [Nannocystis exedens]|nr:serine/threonine protein kinase [Nannocystis exedens]
MSRSHKASGPLSNDPMIGALVDGRYRINRLIGRGGVGVVYHATDRETDGAVVIKILAPNWVNNTEILARFDREVERLSGLQHPNIVDLFGFGRYDGRAYMVMEYIEGELLKNYIRRKRRLSLEEFVPIAGQILKGIGYAHSRGLMHRDLNPANIMLCVRDGEANVVKILDFGLAKLKEGEVKVTEQHDLLGTAGFLAPEQIKGEHVDLRVDVYALGVMFYNMLSGRMPFEGEHNATLLYKHVHEPPLPLDEILPVQHTIPVHLMRLVHDCLEKNPDQRPEDANEMVEDLIDCVPQALFRLPKAEDSEIEVANATMVGLGIDGVMSPTAPGHWPAVQTPMSGGHGPPRPILVEETDDEDEDEDALSDETVAGEGIADPAGTAATGEASPGISSAPTLRGSASAFLDEGIEASTSALPSRAYVPQNLAAVEASVPVKRGRSGLILLGASLALLLGAGVAYILLNPGSEEQPAAKTMDEADVRAALDRAEQALGEQDFRAVTRELDATKGYVGEFPAEQARAERISKLLVLGQLLATARKLEGEGNDGAALSTYKDVLTRDPTDAEAREAVERLTAVKTTEEPKSGVGSVVITSTPRADLYIDGTSFGKTPFSGQLPVGAHTVRLETRLYEAWESSISVKSDKNDPFKISMRRIRGKGSRVKPAEPNTTAEAVDPPPSVDPVPPDSGDPESNKDGGDGLFLEGKKKKGDGIFLPVGD